MSSRISDEAILEAKNKAYHHESRLSPAAFNMFGRDQCVAEAQRKHSDREEVQLMINRANAGLDALTETADPYWKGYWKGLKDWGESRLKEIKD